MASRRQGAGRKGGLQEARELVAIISSLDHAGDSLDVETIAGRLGISEQDARHRMDLILAAGGEGAAVLPLSEGQDNDRLTLEGSSGSHVRRLRLTKSETVAVKAALDQMEIPADAPLRQKIAASLSSQHSTEAQAPAPPSEGGDESGNYRTAEALLQCSKAIAQLGMLDFSYQGVADKAPRRRHVDPRGLRNADGVWYLDAYDPSRQGERVFRLDRMTDVLIVSAEELPPEPQQTSPEREVRITFRDRHYLELLAWPDLHVERDDGSVVVTRIPYYGGEWLPRRIAACAGAAFTSDGEVKALAIAYARRKLGNSSLRFYRSCVERHISM